jgi:hypothetical protein
MPLDEAFASPVFFENQATVWRRLREEAPVFWSDRFQAWLVSRYDDCAAILKDSARFSSRLRLTKWLEQLPPETHAEVAGITRYYERGVVQADPPDHAPMRTAMNKAFTPRVIEGLRARIQEFVDDRIDACALRGRLELVADLAFPLPVTIICELVGVPPEDEARYLAWTHRVFDTIGSGAPELESIRAAQSGMVEMEDYFRNLFEQRRREPREDLLSALVNLPDAERGMSEDDLRANFGTFISAGHESTSSLIVNGLIELLRHPDQVAAVVEDSTLVNSAVEEMLRWVTPFQRDMRLPTVDVEVRGETIPANDLVWCLLAAANRDPEQFADPEHFDVRRRDNRHLAFALGPHYCLGAPLARQEAVTVIHTLTRRLRGLRLAEQNFEIPPDYRLRTPRTAWVEFDSAAPRSRA